MRRLSFGILAVALLLVASCKKQDTAAPASYFKIQFQPKFGSANLILDSTYSTADGTYLNFASIGFYLSHIKLVRTDNTTVEVDSAVLLNYNNSAITFSLNFVPGTYKAITFGIGLDSTQNLRSPVSYPADPVYGNSALYWDDSRLHLFIQLLGYDGTSSSLGGTFFYHEGNDSVNMYRTATVAKNFTITAGQPTTLVLNADLEQVFQGANAVNVFTQPGTHTRDYPQTATVVADAFSRIFSIQD